MVNNRKKQIITSIFVLAIFIIAAIIASIIIKYQVEGETNMPFKISKIAVVSSASGVQKENTKNKWELELVQNNDIYINIVKNKNYSKTEIIDKIILDNFYINQQPQKGNLKLYRPNNTENGVYTNAEEYLINNKLEYIGNEKSNIKNLQIANQGGIIFLRYVNENLGKYISNEDIEIKHDGTLLQKIGIKNEELKCKISFDLSIVLTSEKTYKANIELEIPVGNIINEGTSSYEKTDFKDIVFKRL